MLTSVASVGIFAEKSYKMKDNQYCYYIYIYRQLCQSTKFAHITGGT